MLKNKPINNNTDIIGFLLIITNVPRNITNIPSKTLYH